MCFDDFLELGNKAKVRSTNLMFFSWLTRFGLRPTPVCLVADTTPLPSKSSELLTSTPLELACTDA